MPEKKKKTDKAQAVINAYQSTKKHFDPQGSYTGTSKSAKKEKPMQDADDL